jgi:hypothetical protein
MERQTAVFDLQNSKFPWSEYENSRRQQSKTYDEHDSCGHIEAGEDYKPVPSTDCDQR